MYVVMISLMQLGEKVEMVVYAREGEELSGLVQDPQEPPPSFDSFHLRKILKERWGRRDSQEPPPAPRGPRGPIP